MSDLDRSVHRAGRLAMNTMHRGMWFDKYDNIYCLAVALVKGGCLIDTKELLDYMEKPWKWTREFELWEKWGKPNCNEHEGWQEWLDAVEAPDDPEAADRYYRELDNARNEER